MLSAKTRIMIVAGQHGDEPNPIQSVLALSEKLSSGYWPGLGDHCVFIVVPIVNPDGFAGHTRRNAQNLDINRDWKLLRTPEARFIDGVIRSWKPHTLIDVHEWTSPSSSKRNTIEVPTTTVPAQASHMTDLAKVTAIRSGLLVVRSRANAEPGLLHRHYVAKGFASFLLETSAGLHSSTKYRLYENAIIALATRVSRLERKELLSPASAGFRVPDSYTVSHIVAAKSANAWGGALIVVFFIVLGILFYVATETEHCNECLWLAVLLKCRRSILRSGCLPVYLCELLTERFGLTSYSDCLSIKSYASTSWKAALCETHIFRWHSGDLIT